MGVLINQEAPAFEADTIAGSVSNDEVKEIFGEWKSPKPYIRIVRQPR